MVMDKHNIKLDAKFSKIAPLPPFDRQASRKRIRNVFLEKMLKKKLATHHLEQDESASQNGPSQNPKENKMDFQPAAFNFATDNFQPETENLNLQTGNSQQAGASHSSPSDLTNIAPSPDIDPHWDSHQHPRSSQNLNLQTGNSQQAGASHSSPSDLTNIAPSPDIDSHWDSHQHPRSSQNLNLQTGDSHQAGASHSSPSDLANIAPSPDIDPHWDSLQHPRSSQNLNLQTGNSQQAGDSDASHQSKASHSNMPPPHPTSVPTKKLPFATKWLLIGSLLFIGYHACISILHLAAEKYQLYPLDQLKIVGTESTGLDEKIQGQTLLSNIVKQRRSLLLIDDKKLASTISQMPEVKKVSVHRIFPSTLIISVVENTFLVIIKENANFYAVDPEKPTEKLNLPLLKDQRFFIEMKGLSKQDELFNRNYLNRLLTELANLPEKERDLLQYFKKITYDRGQITLHAKSNHVRIVWQDHPQKEALRQARYAYLFWKEDDMQNRGIDLIDINGKLVRYTEYNKRAFFDEEES